MTDHPLRILHVTPYYEPAYLYGGPIRSVSLLCRGLVDAGAEVAVFTTTANGTGELDVPASGTVCQGGVSVQYFPRVRPRPRFRSPAMATALEVAVRDYDIVHITGLWTYPSAVAAATAASARVPYVVSPRGMLMPWEMSHKAWKKMPYLYLSELPRLRASAGMHCTSTDEREPLHRFALWGRSFVVPNIVDVAELSCLPPRGAMRNRLGLPQDAVVMLSLGRLHAKKGIELTLDSFASLASHDTRLHLVIAGPDEAGYADRIAAWRVKQGLVSRVHVPGELRGVERLEAYSDADLFISLSESENFGMAAAEAMACGLPVVLSRGVGLSGWVTESGAGIIVERDAEIVAAGIRALLLQPGQLASLGIRGKALAASEFSARSVAHQMLAAYADRVAVAGRSRLPGAERAGV